MLTKEEEKVIRQLGQLFKDVQNSDNAAIGVKECLRNYIESERLKFNQLVDEWVTYPEISSALSWNKTKAKLALSVYVLDGSKPKNLPWQREWIQGAIIHLRDLQKLEGRKPIRAKKELIAYFLWTVAQAIIITDASSFLEQWISQRIEQEKKEQTIQKLKKEVISKRFKGKKALPHLNN